MKPLEPVGFLYPSMGLYLVEQLYSRVVMFHRVSIFEIKMR